MIRGGLREQGVLKEGRPGKPLVTVITVVLNGAEHLVETLESVLSQDYQNVEYLVLDGGSTDGTLDIIRRYAGRLDLWVSEPDGGIYDAMNRGISLARGDIIGLLNADDAYLAGALAAVAAGYRAGEAAILYGHTTVVQEDAGIAYDVRASESHAIGMGWFHPAMFVSRSAYDLVGLYDTAYRFAADYDFLLRARGKVAFIAVDRLLVRYRDGGRSAQSLRTTLSENCRISLRHNGRFSGDYVRSSVARLKSVVVMAVDAVICRMAGERAARKVRHWYLKRMIAGGGYSQLQGRDE